jgi:hypothetical protein
MFCSRSGQNLINKHKTTSLSVQKAMDVAQHSAGVCDFLLSVKDVHIIKQNHDAVYFKQHKKDAVSISIMERPVRIATQQPTWSFAVMWT